MSAHSISPILNIIQSLQQQAANSGQRRVLVCSGETDWCQQIARLALKQLKPESRSLYVGESDEVETESVISAGKSRQWLGRELDFLVFDAWYGFDVDAFGALSGTLCAGGVLLLLTPDLEQWANWSDPEHRRIQVYPQALEEVSGFYLQRLAHLIRHSDQAALCRQENEAISEYLHLSNHIEVSKKSDTPEYPCKTLDQQQAVTAIHRIVKGHRRRPLVLTADRGRGKSAALGIAAAQLINEGQRKILVTAPARKNTEVLYRHASELVDSSENLHEKLIFVAPDELAHQLPDADLLLVDEAAAIPVPILERLLNRYSRIVFASTIHGYEGTGRGFAIRFRHILNNKTPQWRPLHLAEPIRWQADDPLESFVFDALLLNAEPAAVDDLPTATPDQYEFRKISSSELVNNEPLLKELFGLLILAHYQTRPFDLRHMLDGGNIEIYGLFLRNHLLGTVLAAREGEIEDALQEPIWLGQRRVRGHLLPQSLSHHLGIKTATRLIGMRIIRIAVHPQRQQRGLGLHMLSELEQTLTQRGFDYLGASFGATDELLAFWHRSGLKTVRMGITRDAASGTHSALMIKPLSPAGAELQEEGLMRFGQQFQWLLLDELKQLEAGVVVKLLKQRVSGSDLGLSRWQQQDFYSHCQGKRQYDSCIVALKIRAQQLLVTRSLSEQQQQLLVGRVLQNRSWSSMAEQLGLSGGKQVRAMLRGIFIDTQD